MAKTGKDYFDEIATIYSISEQSVMNHVDDKEKIQHIAACAALLAVRLCKNWGLNPIDAAPHIPYWLWLIINNPNFFNIQFEQAPLPQGVKTENRPDGQRQGGIDYTSKENIHKVIDPLFLDELKEELADIKAAPPSVVKCEC
ncbi:MAG: hypothetical protein IJT73_08085 [Selenomonadaceae bacterium]|nr:hypothetical protein [Selenomonadaceae bacterium]